MRRLRQWLVRVAVAAALAAVAVAIVNLAMGASIARRVAVGKLRAMGLEVKRLESGRPGFRALHLSNLEIGPDAGLSARSITIRYDLGALVFGRVEAIEVSDAVWTVGAMPKAAPRSGHGPSITSSELPLDRLELRSGTIRLTLDGRTNEIAIDGALRSAAGRLVGAVTLAGDLVLPGGLSVSEARATIPVTIGLGGAQVDAGTNGTATFSTASTRLGERSFPGVGGSFTVQDRRLSGIAAWPVAGAGELELVFSADLGAEPLRGEVLIPAADLAVEDPRLFARLLLGDQAADWRVDGTIGLEGRIDFDGSTRAAHLDARISGGSLESPALGVEIGGIEGAARLSGLTPPVSEPSSITFSGGRAGSLPLSEGEVRVSLDESGMLTVSELRWQMGEYGRFEAEPFSVSPDLLAVRTRITGSEMGLGPWLALLTRERAEGKGTLRGAVTVDYDPSRRGPVLALGPGMLEAHPPAGWIRTGGREEVRDLLAASDPRFGEDGLDAEVGDRIADALRDFDFTLLGLEFIEEAGGTLLRAEIAGRGRHGEEPLEIGSLTMNIRGFEEYLSLALRFRRGLD